MNADGESSGDISSITFGTGFDEERIKSESTLTSMSYTKDKDYPMSRTHSSISVTRMASTIYQPSRVNAKRRPLRHLWLSQAAYGKTRQGNKMEFFDKHFMAYMTVRIRHTQ